MGKKKNKLMVIFIIASILLTFLVLIVFANNKSLFNTSYYLYLGLFILLIIQFFILGNFLIKLFTQIESLSKELQQKNLLLSKVDRFKDQFISSTSQELKLPINNIISAAESVIRKVSPFLLEQSKEDLASIIKTGKGLTYMLDNFVDYVDIKQGNIDLNLEHLEAHEIINYIIELFEPFVADKEIEFENNIEPNEIMVIADQNQLIQIFYNLLGNVCEYIEEGVIFFKAEKVDAKVEISLETTAANILFKYQDYRAGLEQEAEFILNKSDLKQSITQQLISFQEGDLQIKKLANKLLVIVVTLPGSEYNDFYELEEANTQLATLSEISKNEIDREGDLLPQGKYILIVGDQVNKINSLKNILAQENYFIKTVKDKKRALEELNSEVALVILNLFALDEFTLELCQEIRERFRLFELPILVMVSRSSPQNLISGFEVGINDFIKEPFEISELKARVRTLITLKAKVEESIEWEQDFLRAQIKPHFLYNTLDTIAFLCEHNSERARDLILDLANYLRYSFDFESLNRLVSIDKELELVNFYLTIQQARFGDRVKVRYKVEEGLSFGVPPLILQPLVENAVKHGVLKRKEGGSVEINISRREKFFVIKVIDDGIGMTEEELANLLTTESKGRRKIGLENINKRLKKLYNQELKINSSLKQGTTVEFKIPEDKFRREGS
ncbi:histidine kinase [Fuchsiella alkaliacetigena]|uniref:histidine kinase n=1 Tax=Fuchsiella alkaliacetigena TaxID=957042 RepID=UPI00200A1601|nr:histidine kinase [Fuchsiella alkaliacetigena]MCK8824048.1 histidine kinase [Fuchsiella alkaliacetigena]